MMMNTVAVTTDERKALALAIEAKVGFKVRVLGNAQKYAYGSVNVRPAPVGSLWTLAQTQAVAAALVGIGCRTSAGLTIEPSKPILYRDGLNFVRRG